MIDSPIRPVIYPVIESEFYSQIGESVPDPGNQLLLESSDFLLLEDGGTILLE